MDRRCQCRLALRLALEAAKLVRMKIPLQITLRGVDASEALETRVRAKAEDLERFYPPLMSCRIVVEMQARHRHQGRNFNVRIHLGVPGGEIAIDRDHHEDVYVAVRDAFDAARRKLEDYGHMQRGDEKLHATTAHGRVARLDRDGGFGFIETSDGREFYFSSANVVAPAFASLDVGAQVQFLEDAGSDGPQAKRVSVGKHVGG